MVRLMPQISARQRDQIAESDDLMQVDLRMMEVSYDLMLLRLQSDPVIQGKWRCWMWLIQGE